ncbi:pregnancy zone protein-like isoform X2 [Ceratina calcarata]|uniref:TEP1-F n=1 Tax=Ceratina calcarata TaxID=156304 RepID=A0AAJ7NC46_9HYME|nr:pregnancy zone protein-like isoform X2 [Ceratina calcarata]
MDKLVTLLVILIYSLGLSHGSKSVTNRGYLFTAPRNLLAGETVSGCLSLHNLKPPAYVTLQLLNSWDKELIASTNILVNTSVEICMPLEIPWTPYFRGFLRLKIKFDKYPSYVVEEEKEVVIVHDSVMTFVETDKVIYKPGQDVNIRILMLRHNLKPWKEPIPKVWIENPSEVRVAEWRNVNTENGLVQLKFPLSPEPSSGTWNIKVEKIAAVPGLIHTTKFEVDKYVLPRFQITINSPEYILMDAQDMTWNICVRYTYGKPVKGTLLLKLTPQTPSWERKPHLPAIRYETEFDKPDGCTDFVLSGTVLGLAHWQADPNNVVLVAEFTEAGTGVVETTISRTVVMHEALKLEFENYTPKYFKLGLPYHGKLRVLQHDNTPMPNIKIQVCMKVLGEIKLKAIECRDFMSSTDGFVDFIVPPQDDKNIDLLTFVATAIDYPTKYYTEQRWRVLMNQPSATAYVNPWYSPSDSYLTVARGNQPIVCGEKYSFNVMYTVPPNMTDFISFHYSINSKSSILIYGHVKHKPTHDTILNYSEFRNLLDTVESTNKTDVYPMVHRFPLSVKVTPSMAPVSELLLYYVKSDGEIVATTYTIEVGHCFENKVKTAWHTDVQTPGSKTQYHVEAAPWSLCGISVVDKSTIFLGKSQSNLINATGTFHQLRKYHPSPKPSSYMDSWRDCKQRNGTDLPSRRRKKAISYDRSINYVDAMQAFNDFGVIAMSDLTLVTRPCPPKRGGIQHTVELNSELPDFSDIPMIDSAVAAAAIGVAYNDQLLDQTAKLRSYFPETWLWTLTPTGKEGKATIDCTLPDTITDWVGYTTCISPVHGLGIAPPTTITAFQVFFLDYRLPYSVKRGEMMRLKASLFNYMNHSLPVKIKLDEIAGIDLHLSDPNVSFCVKPRDSIVHEFVLRPRILGEVNITVSASIDESYSEPCGPETLLYTRDIIVKPILILPEGFPVEKTESSLVCPKDFADDSAFVWELTLPEDVIPDSGRAYLNLIGDILGPALENLDKLVELPKGCGEQNMILFVPNIHVIKYLDAIKVDNHVLRAKAIGNMEKGYQRELNYRLADGSYSAFSSSQSSIWLTAFVLKSFAQAQSLIHIEERELRLSVEWIKQKQLKTGCFEAIGNVFRKQIKGGLHEYEGSLPALTAYILIALVESGVPLPPSLTKNALNCLGKGIASNNAGLYTEILATYALTLLEHPNANSSMRSLINLATSQNNLLWWEDKTKPSRSLSIEMTAYAILILVKLGGEENMIVAFKAVRWLSKQRNAEGGFSSTQDTVVGLEALTKYAIAVQSSNILSVLITAKEVEYAYKLNSDNRMVLTQIRLPVLPTTVEIFTQGEGCVLIQSNIKYNVPHIDHSQVFDLSVGIRPFKYEIECLLQQITICARYTMSDGESNMALLEVNMISGYMPDRATLNALLDPSSKVKRFEVDHDVVTIYFDKLTGQSTCISFNIIQEYFVDRLEPANVKLYDYYQQELTVSTNYKIASICSSAEPIDKQVTNEKMLLEATDESESSSIKISNSLQSTNGFVITDQELETPDGIEGPVWVYINPNDDYKTETTTTTNGLADFTTAYTIEDETVPLVQPEDEEPPVEPEIEIKNTTMVTETNVPSPTGAVIQHCPVCMDKLPSDIRNVYCSASSAAKVAIRRLRKARLLLDLHAARQVQRLYGKIEFTLSPNCSCPPLDDPGSFALIMNKNNDFLSSGDHKQTLDDSFHIYGLPLVSGMPCKLAEARTSCFNEENIPCTNEKDSLVYG